MDFLLQYTNSVNAKYLEMIVKVGFQYTPSVAFKLDCAICNLMGGPFLLIKIT